MLPSLHLPDDAIWDALAGALSHAGVTVLRTNCRENAPYIALHQQDIALFSAPGAVMLSFKTPVTLREAVKQIKQALEALIHNDSASFDLSARRIHMEDGSYVSLTERDSALLAALSDSETNAIKIGDLADKILGRDDEYTRRRIHSALYRLRRKKNK